MKKAVAVLAVCILLAGVLNGCSLLGRNSTDGSIVANQAGYADGGIGDTLRNVWFEYTVVDAKAVDEYAGVTPSEGNILIDTVIEIHNICGIDVPMMDQDFQIQWGSGGEDYGYVVEAVDEAMLPETFTLEKGQTVTYHAVYEVPGPADKDVEYSISFMERFIDGESGNAFFVYFKL